MRQHINHVLVNGGFARNRDEAAVLVMSGRVYLKGQRLKAGAMLPQGSQPEVRGLHERYLSKGGYKLEAALKTFGINAAGRVCIDAGASTGGFTDCLRKQGAALVYAVDAGFGQLMGELRQDARVVNLERTNIGDESLLRLDPRPDLGSCDLSYLSLRKGIPCFREVLHGQGELLCLVKPLFETRDMDARRSGEIRDADYEPLLGALIADVNAMENCRAIGVCHSPVTGNTATLEFFLHVVLGDVGPVCELGADITKSVRAALLLPRYRKGLMTDKKEG